MALDTESQLLREGVLSLSALRALRSTNDEETLDLRRYIFGLSLVAFTAPQEPLLRMGCELTGDPENPATWELVKGDGTRESFSVSHDEAIAFAQKASEEFGVTSQSRIFTFDYKKANEALREKNKNKKSE